MKLILVGSLFFSIWQSILLWGKKPGISSLLLVIPLLLYFIFFLNKNQKVVNQKGLLWGIPIICLSLTYFLFENYFLGLLNILAIGTLWLIMCVRVTETELKLKDLIEKMLNLAFGAFEHIGNAIKSINQLLKNNSNQEKSKKAKQ